MLLHVQTDGLYEAVFVDGRHDAEQQWQTVAAEVAKRRSSAEIVGAYVITDNPNRRPYYTRGQKLRK